MDLKRGDVIADKYEITGTLGQGGMGIVYSATHRALGGSFALKFPSRVTSPDARARFLREARAIASIRSEHVVRVSDVGTTDSGAPFMVMEHLHGEDLAATLKALGRLPLEESIDLLVQACEAVHQAHMLGIVHRDLKPGNLFVAKTAGGRRVVKVLDFGISKLTADEGSMTQSSVVVGSPGYMSPEQHLSPRHVDQRTDVWALGVILYEMLAGRTPFKGETVPALWEAIRAGQFPKLSTLREGIPREVEETIAAALTIDRDTRISTVVVLADRLARFGTDAARALLLEIKAIGVPGAEALATPEAASTSDATVPPQMTSVELAHAPPIAPVATAPAPRRWPRAGTVGVIGVVVAGGAVASWWAVHRSLTVGTSPPLVAATVADAASPAPSSGASPSGGCASGATPECEAACASHVAGACKALAAALEEQCHAGVFAACTRAGVLHARGSEGMPPDSIKAIDLYTRGCEGGHARGCTNLGAMYFETRVAEKEKLATHYFIRGCDDGDMLGCLYLSVAYGEGRGVKKDAQKSVAFAQRACDGGEPGGCARVAFANVTGEGVAKKDVEGGLAELKSECKRRQVAGCELLVTLYTRGTEDVDADPVFARDYAKQACDLGSAGNCDAQKGRNQLDKTSNRAAQRSASFQAQCDSGNMVACAQLAETLAKSNPVRSKELSGMACKGDVKWACAASGEARKRE